MKGPLYCALFLTSYFNLAFGLTSPRLNTLTGVQRRADDISCGAIGVTSVFCIFDPLKGNSDLNTLQAFRLAISKTSLPDTTKYGNGENIICIPKSTTLDIGGGEVIPISFPIEIASGGMLQTQRLVRCSLLIRSGICIFPEKLTDGPLTLKQIKPLVDELINEGCETCGQIPIHYNDTNPSNRAKGGVLKVDYKDKAPCINKCIGPNESAPSSTATSTAGSTKATTPRTTSSTIEPLPSQTFVLGALPPLDNTVTAGNGIALPPTGTLQIQPNTAAAIRASGSAQPVKSAASTSHAKSFVTNMLLQIFLFSTAIMSFSSF